MTNPSLQRLDGSALRFLQTGETAQPTSIVFMLHGSGSHAGNLLPVAQRLAPRLPGALFVLPNAPQSYVDVLSYGDIADAERSRPGMNWEEVRTWVAPGADNGDDERSKRQSFFDSIRPPVRAVSRLADLFLTQYALSDASLALYGFSQGGMLAMYLGIARPTACAGIVCHSGHFLGADEVRSRPRSLLVLGALELQPDQVMSQIYPLTTKALRALDVPFDELISDGLGHDVNQEVIDRAVTFFHEVLGAGPTAAPTAEAEITGSA
jgi:phospholipase/carboxylesterase